MAAMVTMLMVGAFIFMRFLAISELSFMLGDFISQLALSRYGMK